MTTLPRLLLLCTFGLASTLAHAAGFSFIEVPADKDGPALRGAVWSPCPTPAGKIALDPLVIDGVHDCPISAARLPLVVVSHGRGGSFLGHHDTAAALADAGFVVAAISHPRDNFQDASPPGTMSVYATRPVDIKRLVDYMLGGWTGRAALDPGRVGIFGFSRGGYTALATIGAVPNFGLREDLCTPNSGIPNCVERLRSEPPPPLAKDARIKAAVIADPLSFFDARGLQQVSIPVQLWASALGGDNVTPESVAAVRAGLPKAPEWHVAANAGHFAFIAPCPPAMAKALPEICVDKPGFDRAAFHAGLNADVVRFFRKELAPPARP